MELPSELSSLDFQADFADTPPAILLDWAQLVHANLCKISDSSSTGVVVGRASEWLDVVRRAVAANGVFSKNEEKEDIVTDSLKYLLVPYYIAELLSYDAGMARKERRGRLVQALGEYDNFLRRCSQYKLLGEQCRIAWERMEADEGVDAYASRTEKIARFQREKGVMSNLGRLRALKERKIRLEQDAEELTAFDGYDEESERELWELSIEHAALKSISQKEAFSQEIKPQVQEEEKSELAAMGQLKSIAADLLNQNGRVAAQKQVFQPSHILPKYTIQQQAEWEMAAAAENGQRQKAAEAQMKKNEADDDNDNEEELKKQRAWDDWKDDHPFGYGNSKLRPCG